MFLLLLLTFYVFFCFLGFFRGTRSNFGQTLFDQVKFDATVHDQNRLQFSLIKYYMNNQYTIKFLANFI